MLLGEGLAAVWVTLLRHNNPVLGTDQARDIRLASPFPNHKIRQVPVPSLSWRWFLLLVKHCFAC